MNLYGKELSGAKIRMSNKIKIYCVLFDAMPFSKEIVEFANANDMRAMRQIGSTWTGAACIQMFTGKMLSDIREKGIGYKSKESFPQNGAGKKHVDWPWKEQILLHTFSKNNWKVQYHNGDKFNEYLLSDDNIVQSPRFITDQRSVINTSEKAKVLMKRELKYIRNIQKEEVDSNTFHFIRYEHYHDAFGVARRVIARKEIKIKKEIRDYWEKRNKKRKGANEDYSNSYINDLSRLERVNDKKVKKAMENSKYRSFELMKEWNLNEPNAIFWFFSDHGDLNLMKDIKHPDPTMYYTWVMVKDNTEKSINVKSDFISDRDFFVTLVNKFNYDYLPLIDRKNNLISDTNSIELEQDQNRVYYVEDGRSVIDKYCSTTAIVSKLVDWKDGKPGSILQVSYHAPDKEWRSSLTPLDKNSFCGKTCGIKKIDKELKQKLIERFEWVS